MAIAVAQVVFANGAPSANTITVNITPTAGSTLVVWVSWDSVSTTTCTVADNHNAGNYSANGPYNDATDQQCLGIFHHEGVAGTATTITATFGVSADSRHIAVAEITGSNGGSTDGGTGQVQATPGTGANAITTGNMTNATQPALIVALSMNITGLVVPTVGTGYSSNGSDATFTAIVASKRITTTGSTQTATFTDATNGAVDTYVTAAFIFDEGAGGALAKVPPLNETSFRRPSPRPLPFGGEPLEPLVKRGAGIDTSPASSRLALRPIPFGGDVSAPVAVAPALGKYTDASPAFSRPALRSVPAVDMACGPLLDAYSDVSAAVWRAAPRPLPFGGEPVEPSALPGAGIDAYQPAWRLSVRPQPSSGEHVEPSAVGGAGVSTTPAAGRAAPRPQTFGGDGALALTVGPFADTSLPIRRLQPIQALDSGAVTPPQVVPGAGIDTSPAAWRPMPRPRPDGAEPAIRSAVTPGAGVSSWPAAWRTAPRPIPAGGDVAAVGLAPPVLAPLSEARTPDGRRPSARQAPSPVDAVAAARGAAVTEASWPAWRAPQRALAFGGEAAGTLGAPRVAAEASQSASRPGMRAQVFGGDAADALGAPVAWVEPSQPARRAGTRPIPWWPEATRGSAARPPLIADAVVFVRASLRAPPTFAFPLGALPAQTIVIARSPARPTRAIGENTTSAVGTTAPTKSKR